MGEQDGAWPIYAPPRTGRGVFWAFVIELAAAAVGLAAWAVFS